MMPMMLPQHLIDVSEFKEVLRLCESHGSWRYQDFWGKHWGLHLQCNTSILTFKHFSISSSVFMNVSIIKYFYSPYFKPFYNLNHLVWWGDFALISFCTLHHMLQAYFDNLWLSTLTFMIYLYKLCMTSTSIDQTPVSNIAIG